MFRKVKVVKQMKNRLKALVIGLIFASTINTSFAVDYYFASKSSQEYYYEPTSYNLTTVGAVSSNSSNIVNNSVPGLQYGYTVNNILENIILYSRYTGKNEVLRSDGSIGTLKISKIDLNLKVYDGTTASSMKNGVGHFTDTSYWDGNIGLAAHNRGVNNNFGKLKKLSKGDIVTYKTELGTRKYEVFYVGQIGVTDLSRLSASNDNMITMITCVEDQPLLRLCVQAKEI